MENMNENIFQATKQMKYKNIESFRKTPMPHGGE